MNSHIYLLNRNYELIIGHMRARFWDYMEEDDIVLALAKLAAF